MCAEYLVICVQNTWVYVCIIPGYMCAEYLVICVQNTWVYVCRIPGYMCAVYLVICGSCFELLCSEYEHMRW